MLKTNYHGHTKWCNHAEGEIEDVVVAAINAGLSEVAITEHTPLQFSNDYTTMRLQPENVAAFFTELKAVKIKYQDQIKVLMGIEAEYLPNHLDFYRELKKTYELDIIVLGHHFNQELTNRYFFVKNDEQVLDYGKEVCEALETGVFDFFAHPDVFLNSYKWTDACEQVSKQILKTCERLQIPVEINANGIRENKGYPDANFWKLAQNYQLTVIVNSDSHTLRAFDDPAITKAYQLATDNNLEVTEFLEFKK